MKFVAAFVSITVLASCATYQPRKASTRLASPRDHYEDELYRSHLGKSQVYDQWVHAGRYALRSGLAINPSFREIVYFHPKQPTAVGYRLQLHRGQRVRIDLERRSAKGRMFAEVFEEIGPFDPIYRLVYSGDPRRRSLSFEANWDGVHVLRLQPEALKGGEYAVTVTTDAALTFPVLGKTSHAIGSFFGDPRDGGQRDHEGIDIFAPRGTPVVAVAAGVISQVNTTPIGGRVVWQHDPERNVTYYYAHLQSQSVRTGARVRAGDEIGTVGNTGNARTTPPHLHFAVYRPGRVAINPVPFIFDAPAEPVYPVVVDLGTLGQWLRTKNEATLHTAPSYQATVITPLPPDTRVYVLSGVRDWHRVLLGDGRAGFISSRSALGEMTGLGGQ